VLICPLVLLFQTVKREHLLSLVILLLYSGAAAVYYLFIDKKTY